MKTMKSKTIAVALILAIFTFAATTYAQPGNGDGKHKRQCCVVPEGKNGCFGIKGLTEEQQKKITSLREAHRKDMQSYRDQLGEKNAHLKTLLHADNPDRGAINKTIDEMGSLKTEMMKKSTTHQLDVRNLLTDEQKLEFDARGFGRGFDKGFHKRVKDSKHCNHSCKKTGMQDN